MSIKILTPATPIHVLDGAAWATFTAFQNISPEPQIIIPQQTLEAGLEIELIAWGEHSSTGTPNLQIGFWFNGAVAPAVPTSVFGLSGVVAVAGIASAPWMAKYHGRLRVAQPNNAASWNGQGSAKIAAQLAGPFSVVPMPITLALRTVTADVSAARAIGVGAAWSASSASNSVKVNGLSARLVTGY